MEKIRHLESTDGSSERTISFISDRTRLITGETKDIAGKWFYRIKVYGSGFIDKKTGEWIPFRGHELRPSGRWKYIQELDIPVTKEGIDLVKKLKTQLYGNLEWLLKNIHKNNEIEFVDSIRNYIILSDGDLPWITTPIDTEIISLNESIFDAICEYIEEEEVTDEIVASRLNISKNLAKRFINVFSRYDPIYLNKGLVVDRFRGPHGNIHFRASQIPLAALRESPCLDKLLHGGASGKWPAWKRVTFSGDDYPQSKRASLEFARYEVRAFCGGKRWDVPFEESIARSVALRLFDLLRYYENQQAQLKIVEALAQDFIWAVSKERTSG
jgi:hypothetical protein